MDELALPPTAPLEASEVAPSAPGLTPPSGRFEPTTFLSDVIVALGLADDERVESALQAARNPGNTLEGVLLESGVLSEEGLALALSERHGVSRIDLAAYPSHPSAEELIDPEVARACDALPVGCLDDGALLVAMADPVDWLAAEEIARATGLRVRPAAATAAAVRASIEAASKRRLEETRRGGATQRGPVAAGPPLGNPPSTDASPAGVAGSSTVASATPSPSSDADYADLERRLAERAAHLEWERDQLERERAELRATRRLDGLVPTPS